MAYYIQSHLLHIQNIEYFSDGCSGQYKNFLNFTYQKHDFDVDASRVFFATSHEKSSCDGIGGMVKQELTQESLMRPR